MKRACLLLLVLGALTGCGSSAGAGEKTTLRVFAAASLTEAFTTLADQFEKEHRGVDVQLNFGPSSGLAQQIDAGAPADVFASASTTNMDAVVDRGSADDPKVFATNTMQIVVPPRNPAGINTLADLARADAKVALCQPQVPCGVVAHEVLDNAGVEITPATEEVDVKSVLTKVRLGEVDAGIVYVTDAKAAADAVRSVPIPAEVNASTSYPVATLTHSEHSSTARMFVDLVLSDQGASVLKAAGFGTP